MAASNGKARKEKTKAFSVLDSDSHIVETHEIWTKYLDPEYRTLGKFALWREEGKTNSYLKVNGKIFRDTMNTNIPRHAIWQPGMSWEDVGDLDPDIRHDKAQGASDAQARLKDMDAMGVDQTVLYPTWFAEGFHLIEDPDVAYAMARAYNDWIADFCSAAPERLFAVAMIPLQNLDFAEEELERIKKIDCFKGAFIRPMFIEDRYFTHPYYDPLWAALERLEITAAVHPANGWWNPEWTSHGQFMEKMKTRLTKMTLLAEGGGGPGAGGGNGGNLGFLAAGDLGHPMSQVISPWLDNHMFVGAALIGFTVMERYPKMKVVMAHGKASWMEEILEKMEASALTFPLLHKYPVSTEPEEMWEDGEVMLGFDAQERMVQQLSEDYVEKVVWGSNYPQQDTTSAWEAIDLLSGAGIEDDVIARMLGGNAAAQFGITPVQAV